MPQPMNYMIDAPNPAQSLLQGIQSGLGINQALQQNQQFGQQQDALAAAKEKAAAAQAAMSALSEKVKNKTAKAEDFSSVIVEHPEVSEHYKKSFDIMESDKQKTQTSQAMQVYSAITSGNIDAAKKILEDKRSAAENSGMQREADGAKAMLSILEANPAAAESSAALFLANAMRPKDFASTLEKIQETRNKANVAPFEIEKLATEIGLTKAQTTKEIVTARKNEAEIKKINEEAGKVAQDAAKIKMEMMRVSPIELSTTSEKQLNDSVLAATNKRSLSKQYVSIANEIKAAISDAGASGKAKEAVKRVFGSEDKITRLRQEYRRLRNTQVLNMLPPGVASDKDIEIAMGAFPEDTANPKVIESFMRGMSKLQQYEATLDEAKAEWISNVGNLGSARSSFTLEGIEITKDSKFNDYAEKLVGKKHPFAFKFEYDSNDIKTSGGQGQAPAEKQIIKTRIAPDGRKVVKYSDGTHGIVK